jgi:nicotinate-nucleotide adenylyltransferase
VNEKLGILGGAFDPIHYGHLLLASEAVHRLGLSRVLLVPTYLSAHEHKEIRASFADRCALVTAAIADFAEFELSEVERQLRGKSYTVKTLKRLRELYPHQRLHFLIGADNLEQLDGWYRPEELVELATLAVGSRPGYEPKLPPLANVVTFEMPLIEISATAIRRRVREGVPIRLLVPPEVERLIRSKGLYLEQ